LKPAAKNDGTTHAGAQGDEDHVIHVLCGTEVTLTERCAAHVVLYGYGHAEPILKRLLYRHVVPFEIRRIEAYPLFRVVQPRHADSYAPDVCRRKVQFSQQIPN